MNRFFPIYAAILGIIALFLFLSPQISELILADQEFETKQILKNNNFVHDSLDDTMWIKTANPRDNIVKIESSNLIIKNLTNDNSHTLLSQRIKLDQNKFYKLSIDYFWRFPLTTSSQASFGIQKFGYESPIAMIIPLSQVNNQTEITKYFKPNNTFQDPYFYIMLKDLSDLEIKSVALEELAELPENISLEDSQKNTFLPITQESNTPIPTIEVPEKNSPIASTHTPIPSPSPSKTVTASPIQPNKLSENSIKVASGWSVISVDEDISSDVFTSKEIKAFQMFGSKWFKTNNTFSNKGAIYLYNGSDEKTIEIEKSKNPSTNSPKKGWNLLSSKDEEMSIESSINYQDSSSELKESKISELIDSKKISSKVYILSNQKGVSIRHIDLKNEKIPARAGYWIYFF